MIGKLWCAFGYINGRQNLENYKQSSMSHLGQHWPKAFKEIEWRKEQSGQYPFGSHKVSWRTSTRYY